MTTALSPRLAALRDALTAVEFRTPLASAFLPVVLRNVANLREHWATKAKRAKAHRSSAYMALRPLLWDLNGAPPPVAVVLLTRVYASRGRRMDDDGAARACKAIRDGVADALGIDDGSERVTWLVDQAKGDVPGVRIEVYARD